MSIVSCSVAEMTPCEPRVVSRGETMSSRDRLKLLGIEFAPLNIPLKRRLETFAVLQWILSVLFMGLTCVALLVALLFTPFYWLTLIYIAWYVYDYSKPEQGGRRFEWVRRWSLWKHYRDFFPISLIKTCDLDPGKNYIFVVHPHGIIGNGTFGNFATDATGFSELFPGIRPMLLTLNLMFMFPLLRDYLMSFGESCKRTFVHVCVHACTYRMLCVVPACLAACQYGLFFPILYSVFVN